MTDLPDVMDAPAAAVLPSRLDTAAVENLKALLLERRGADLVLQTSDVRHLGGLCLQVLLAARTTWAADGFDLRYDAPSEAFANDLRTLGLGVEMLEYTGRDHGLEDSHH